jgi:hypothetical protein
MDMSFILRRPSASTLPRTADQQFNQWRGKIIGQFADIENSICELYAHFDDLGLIEAHHLNHHFGAKVDTLILASEAMRSQPRPIRKLLPRLKELQALLGTRNRLSHAIGHVVAHDGYWLWAYEARSTNPRAPLERGWFVKADADRLSHQVAQLKKSIGDNCRNLCST